jgi:hypothetical protein
MARAPPLRNGLLDFNIEELASLEEPDYQQMRDERSQRTMQAMRVSGFFSIISSCSFALSPPAVKTQ